MMTHQTASINKRQQQIIIGKLLGDGHLETANGRTYRLKIEHSIKQKEYVDWLHQELYQLASNEPKTKASARGFMLYYKCWFNTSYSGNFRFYAQQFYEGRKKVIPVLIRRWLTPLSLAVWFMDDGSIKSKECQAKLLNTQSYNHANIVRLQAALKLNFGFVTTVRQQKDGMQIYVPANQVARLRAVIGPYVIPSMRYKLD